MLLLTIALAAMPAPSGQGPVPTLVNTTWLAERLADPTLVILHIGDQRSRRRYDEGHIPGAIFLNPFAELTAPPTPGGLTLELPSAAQLDSVLDAKGISNDSRVVIYSAEGYATPTARAFFTLEYAGLRGQVAMLDGGLEAWVRENRPTTAEVRTVARGEFTPRLQRDMVVDANWVQAHLNRPSVAIVDARTPQFYHGAEARQARIGHIPGAANLPFNSVLEEDGRFKQPTVLRSLVEGAGAAAGDTVVTYCHIGQQASLAWFTARMLGYEARIYDGSFQDWSARRELPVVAPAAATRDSLLVSAEWLAAHLNDPGLVLLQAERTRAGYDTAHIAGARFVEQGRYSITRDGLPTELAPDDQLLALVRELGISNRSRVIIYGDPLAAARLFFTLDYLGAGDRSALLDGGLAAWQAAGQPTTTTAGPPEPGDIQPRPWPGLVVSAEMVVDLVRDSTVAVIDARTADEFSGARKDTTLARTGHIPGSANIPWQSLMDGPRLKPAAELRRMFEAAGAGPTDEVVTTCVSGHRAAMLFFVSRYLGYRTRMYDGAWAEWNRRMDLPVATGPGRQRTE
jgi:thiosulfate/3-mercaptopyruvate sulfurtransferase